MTASPQAERSTFPRRGLGKRMPEAVRTPEEDTSAMGSKRQTAAASRARRAVSSVRAIQASTSALRRMASKPVYR